MDKRARKEPRPVVTPEPLRNTDDWQDRDDLEEEAAELAEDRLEQARGDEPIALPTRPIHQKVRPSQAGEDE